MSGQDGGSLDSPVVDATDRVVRTLWYLLAGTRGGENRVRVIRALAERPRNTNQVAGTLDVDYNTARYHLEVLEDHGLVESGGEDYGALYFLTDRFRRHREAFERVTDRLE